MKPIQKRKSLRLSRAGAIDRIDMMINIIERDVSIGIEVKAALETARDIAEEAKLAITGINMDFRGIEKEKVRMSRAFWKTALTASAEVERDQS